MHAPKLRFEWPGNFRPPALACSICDLSFVHHIKFKSQGGSDRPDNLITLCEKHHEQLHDGKLKLNVKKHKSLKSATMMNIIRSQLLKTMKSAVETFGYITKAKRQEQKLFAYRQAF